MENKSLFGVAVLLLVMGFTFGYFIGKKKEASTSTGAVEVLQKQIASADSAHTAEIWRYEAVVASLNELNDTLSIRVAEATVQSQTARANLAVAKLKLANVKAAIKDTNIVKDLDSAEADYIATIMADAELIQQQQLQIETLSQLNDTKDSIIASHNAFQMELKSQLAATLGLASNFEKVAIKAEKQASKRVVIGPSVGVGIDTNAKPTIIAGITVTYRLIRL